MVFFENGTEDKEYESAQNVLVGGKFNTIS